MNFKYHPTNEFPLDGTSAALPGSHGPYRTLFNLAPIAVYSCDASGVVQTYNNRAAELMGPDTEAGGY